MNERTMADDMLEMTADLNQLIRVYSTARAEGNIGDATSAVKAYLIQHAYQVEDLRDLLGCAVLHLVQAHTTLVDPPPGVDGE